MYKQRKFTRPQVAAGDSVTQPAQVGSDGNAAFTAYNFKSFVSSPCYYGVQFQMNIADNPSSLSSNWVGISNVGDERGRFGHGFADSVGACISGLPVGAWVRGHIYRLDGNDESYCWLAVRTSDLTSD